jgi:hypothetical protein
MLCPVCKSTARIAKSELKSDVGSTDIYNEQTIVCVNRNHEDNKPCPMYCGEDMSKPEKVIEVIRNKVN